MGVWFFCRSISNIIIDESKHFQHFVDFYAIALIQAKSDTFPFGGILEYSVRAFFEEASEQKHSHTHIACNIASIYYPLGILNKPKTPCACDGTAKKPRTREIE